jgi:hypothetical protein
MLLRLTKRLNDSVRGGTLDTVPLHENPSLDWSAHVFPVNHERYILLSNTQSLLSWLLPSQGITNGAHLRDIALAGIRHCMEANGCEFVAQTVLPADAESVRFAKSLNRSVLGSMNELTQLAELLIEEGKLTGPEIAERLNNTLLSALAASGSGGYGCPKEAFRELVHGL